MSNTITINGGTFIKKRISPKEITKDKAYIVYKVAKQAVGLDKDIYVIVKAAVFEKTEKRWEKNIVHNLTYSLHGHLSRKLRVNEIKVLDIYPVKGPKRQKGFIPFGYTIFLDSGLTKSAIYRKGFSTSVRFDRSNKVCSDGIHVWFKERDAYAYAGVFNKGTTFIEQIY